MDLEWIKFEGYWVQNAGDKILSCSSVDGAILNCETESCTTNCHDVYDIENDTLISKQHSNTIGNIRGDIGSYQDIHWGNNITWIKKG